MFWRDFEVLVFYFEVEFLVVFVLFRVLFLFSKLFFFEEIWEGDIFEFFDILIFIFELVLDFCFFDILVFVNVWFLFVNFGVEFWILVDIKFLFFVELLLELFKFLWSFEELFVSGLKGFILFLVSWRELFMFV